MDKVSGYWSELQTQAMQAWDIVKAAATESWQSAPWVVLAAGGILAVVILVWFVLFVRRVRKVGALRRQIEAKSSELAMKTEEVESGKRALDQVKSGNARTIESMKQDFNGQIASLKQQYQQALAEAQQASEEALKKEYEAHQREVGNLQTASGKLTSQIEELRTKLKEARETVATKDGEIASLKRQPAAAANGVNKTRIANQLKNAKGIVESNGSLEAVVAALNLCLQEVS